VNHRLIFSIALITSSFLVSATATESESESDTVTPRDEIAKRIDNLIIEWPTQYVVSIVETLVDQECHTTAVASSDSPAASKCRISVRPDELIAARWLDAKPPAPGAEFVIQYWYSGERPPIAIDSGDRLLVFLVPTDEHGAYGVTVMSRPTPRTVALVRDEFATRDAK